MKIKIGLICFFSMHQEIVKKIAAEISDEIEILTEIALWEDAIPLARHQERLGAEVIVSWGATASILEREISTPVVRIQVRDFDIATAVKEACNFGRKIAILTNETLNGLNFLEEVYDVNIIQIAYKDQNDFDYGIIEAVNEGCEVLIGKGVPTLNAAKEYGKKAILITYNFESVRKALYEAIRIATLRRKEREEYIKLETIFNSLTEGVIVAEDSGRITLFNQAAERILGISGNDALGQSIDKILPSAQASQILMNAGNIDDEFVIAGNNNIIASHKPIHSGERIIGVVSTLRETSEIQKIHSKITKQLTAKGFHASYTIDHFSARSLPMKEVIERTKRFAKTDSNILIIGETGTGKEVLAQSIHQLSLRRGKPFVAINCSVLQESLLESELFGYEEGAFTGAKKGGKMGMFELSRGGTLFLDEMSVMPIDLQSKLLRVLQEKEMMRLGGERLIPLDVRIIASTNRDLSEMMKIGKFREDLYFRLNALSIRMPPLRERKEDIPDLISKFVSNFCKKYRKELISISGNQLNKLQSYSWPGNVRELENVIERFVLMHDGPGSNDLILEKSLSLDPPHYNSVEKARTITPTILSETEEGYLSNKTIVEYEKESILKTLKNTKFNLSKAALLLDMSRSTLYRKLRRFNLR